MSTASIGDARVPQGPLQARGSGGESGDHAGMHLLRPALVALLGLVLPLVLSPTAFGAVEPGKDRRWAWPLSPTPAVVAPFAPPAEQWGAGHRGVDLAGWLGQPVLAIGGGVVSFAGVIAGRGVVVVDHGELRSTYQPVLARVHNGDAVTRGSVIGTLEAAGSHCLPNVCLHLGVRSGDEYVDPLSLLGARAIRLKPPVGDGDFASFPPPAGSAPSVDNAGEASPEHRSRQTAPDKAERNSMSPRHPASSTWGATASLLGGAAAALSAPLALRRLSRRTRQR